MPLIDKPAWLQKDQNNKGELWAPKAQTNPSVPFYTIPGGKFLSVSPKINGYNPLSMVGKGGITHFQDTSAPSSIQLNWIHASIMANSGKGVQTPYGTHGFTEADMQTVVNSFPITSFSADEVAEGAYGMPFDSPEMLYFYQALSAKYSNSSSNPNGVPFRHLGTYGSFAIGQANYYEYFAVTGGSPVMPNNAMFKQYLQTKSKARELSAYHFAHFAPLGIGANIKNYIDRPDYCHIYYLKKFEMEALCFGYGRVGGVGPGFIIYVDWKNIEGLGNALHNGYKPSRKVDSPDGYVLNTGDQHPLVDYDMRVGMGFVLGFCLASGWSQFNVPNRFGTNPLIKSNGQTWSPTTPGTTFPASQPEAVFADYYFDEMFRGDDAGVEAGYYYKEMAATEGEKWKYVPYRFEGSETWINPQTDEGADNGPTTTILEHASAFDGPYARFAGARRGRPDVMARTKNTTGHWWAFDPSLPKGKRENIIVQLTPGKQVSATIQGGVLSPNTETI
ncbi:hypothetical protein [Spirosoma litoris]